MTNETKLTVAESLLALTTDNSPARLDESSLPKLKTADDVREFLLNDAGDYDKYDQRVILANAVKADKLADAFDAVATLHDFYNNMTPVSEVRAELEGRLLSLLSSKFGDDIRMLAYQNADLASRYEKKRIW